METTLDTRSIADYRRFLAIKKLPAYSFLGHQATFPDEYAAMVDGAKVATQTVLRKCKMIEQDTAEQERIFKKYGVLAI